MFVILIAGLFGGIIRGLVGYVKYRSSYKNTSFQLGYLSLSVGISGIVGLLAAWVTNEFGITFLGLEAISPAPVFIPGYAGGDFIENLFKIITGKTSLYKIPDLAPLP